MARWIGPDNDHIVDVLAAAEAWRDRCFIADGSLFGDENLWTLDNIRELRRRVIDDPVPGEGGFIDKFEKQLKPAPPQIKRLAAEALWFLYLFPHSRAMKPETKLNSIKLVWEWSGSSLPDSDYLKERALKGVGRPGRAYMQYYRELGYLCQVLERWKSEPRRSELMAEDLPWGFVAWLDETGNSVWRQIRHAILYFLFPDHLERSVSGPHKQSIFEALKRRLPGEFQFEDPIPPIDLDRALYEIRKNLEKEYGTHELDFYDPPLVDLWEQQSYPSTTFDEPFYFDETPGDGTPPNKFPLNTILYGPPGTGKTYATARRCVEICDGPVERSDADIRRRYGELVKEGRVEFITFHQSYGYEEFVEGLRPETDTGSAEEETKETGTGFRLEPADGVLKRISERARKTPGRVDVTFDLAERQVFKMGLGIPNTESHIFDECIANGYALLNWGGEIDWSDRRYDDVDNILARRQEEDPKSKTQDINVQSITQFRNRMRKRDIIIVPAGGKRFRAVGEVTGNYEFGRRDEGNYPHRRSVRWHWHDAKGIPVSDIYDGVLVSKTIYRLNQERIKSERLIRYTGPIVDLSYRLPHVLVIDEINRANVSKAMGELVTLLEEDKREGAENETAVTLPYSGESFTLPANLHILGTMNTADRSIALLDTALRRRFELEEMSPDPDLLNTVDGIDLPAVLGAINARLEWLLDRDHLIGHAWFMGAKTKADVDRVMQRKIIPLIAEYFHDDWNKVRAVLGGDDDFVRRKRLDPPPGLDDDTGEERYRWTTVRDGFAAGAYDRLVSGRAPDAETEAE